VERASFDGRYLSAWQEAQLAQFAIRRHGKAVVAIGKGRNAVGGQCSAMQAFMLWQRPQVAIDTRTRSPAALLFLVPELNVHVAVEHTVRRTRRFHGLSVHTSKYVLAISVCTARRLRGILKWYDFGTRILRG